MQFGFCKHTDSEYAISFLANLVYDSLDRSKLWLGIFLDITNSFDSVSYDFVINQK